MKSCSNDLSCKGIDGICNTLPNGFSLLDFLDNAEITFIEQKVDEVYRLSGYEAQSAAKVCKEIGGGIANSLVTRWKYVLDLKKTFDLLSSCTMDSEENKLTKFCQATQYLSPEQLTLLIASYLAHVSDFSFLLALFRENDEKASFSKKLLGEIDFIKTILEDKTLYQFLGFLIESIVEDYFNRKNIQILVELNRANEIMSLNRELIEEQQEKEQETDNKYESIVLGKRSMQDRAKQNKRRRDV